REDNKGAAPHLSLEARTRPNSSTPSQVAGRSLVISERGHLGEPDALLTMECWLGFDAADFAHGRRKVWHQRVPVAAVRRVKGRLTYPGAAAGLRLSLYVYSTHCLRQTAVGRPRLVGWKRSQ